MFGVDVANITRMLIVYTQGVVGFGIADQARLPWKYFEDFSNRVIKHSSTLCNEAIPSNENIFSFSDTVQEN